MKPYTDTLELVLTALTPISHHDPAINDKSNTLVFNRQKRLLKAQAPSGVVTALQMQPITQSHLVPEALIPLFEQFSFAQFVATATVRLWLDIYNGEDGTGLFSGMGRYDMLWPRLRVSAIRSANLRQLWDRTCNQMKVGIHPSKYDESLIALFALPVLVQYAAVKTIEAEYDSLTAVARYWHTEQKNADPQYAAKSGKQSVNLVALEFPESIQPIQSCRPIDMPEISSNSVRHQLVRWPSWVHLYQSLGLKSSFPGGGDLNDMLESTFVNGGNIKQGASRPSWAFTAATKIRQLYPSLDLLRGNIEKFDLGESPLSVASWLVCDENSDILDESSAHALPRPSVFDLVDDTVRTRQATESGVGQMIYNYETLSAGSQVLVRLKLSPMASDLAKGALVAAVSTYEQMAVVGGQSARGHGHMAVEWSRILPNQDELLSAYEAHFATNGDNMRLGLLDGTLGTGQELVN